MERQEVMTKENPPVLVTLIDESVLHRNIGGPLVMRGQLNHLAEMAKHENVVVQVIRQSSPIGAQDTGSFSIASYNGETEVAYLDDALSGDVIENTDEVSTLRRMFEILRKHALSEEDSIRLIREATEKWNGLI
jgi:hypothetical protein